MVDRELDRVRADLAIMKDVCAEPAIPQEEIAISLILAVFGAALAAASWLVPVFWTRLGGARFGVARTAAYLRWKLTIIGCHGPLAAGTPRNWWLGRSSEWGSPTRYRPFLLRRANSPRTWDAKTLGPSCASSEWHSRQQHDPSHVPLLHSFCRGGVYDRWRFRFHSPRILPRP